MDRASHVHLFSRTGRRQRTLVFARRSGRMRVLAVLGLTGLMSGYAAPIAFAAQEPDPTKAVPALDIPSFAFVQFDDQAPAKQPKPEPEPKAEQPKAQEAPAPQPQQQPEQQQP